MLTHVNCYEQEQSERYYLNSTNKTWMLRFWQSQKCVIYVQWIQAAVTKKMKCTILTITVFTAVIKGRDQISLAWKGGSHYAQISHGHTDVSILTPDSTFGLCTQVPSGTAIFHHSLPMKSMKWLACDWFDTFATHAGLVYDVTDTQTAGHKMVALMAMFPWLQTLI